MTKYSPEMVKTVCLLMAEGKTPADIEKMEGMPTARTLANWTWEHPEFYELFDKAREFGTHAMAYNCAEAIEKCPANTDSLAKLKIKMDFFKWFIGKLNQRKYGDRTVIAGDKDNPLTISLASALDHAIAARQARITIDHEPNESVLALPVVETD